MYYFPSGLNWDKTVTGVWDYEFEWATKCKAGNASNIFTAFTNFNAKAPFASLPAAGAKPALKSLTTGGVKSLFKKTSEVKSFSALPDKATFRLDWTEVTASSSAAKTIMSLFKGPASLN